MGPVRDALEREYHGSADGWQSARHGRSLREQAALVRRLAAYGPVVLEHPDVDEVRQGLKRLLADIDHHVQRSTTWPTTRWSWRSAARSSVAR